jgi:hypothetical protein
MVDTLGKNPRGVGVYFVDVTVLGNHGDAFFFGADSWPLEGFDVRLCANSSDEPDFFAWKGFSALFEHVGVSNMEPVENSICIEPEDFFLCAFAH